MIMEEMKPYLAGFIFQLIAAVMFILSKAALNDGMNPFVLTFYRQLAGTIVLVAVVFFKRERLIPLSFELLCKIFMLSLVGITLGYNIYSVALVYTSSTLAAAIVNCLQPVTFFLAVFLRMEKLKLRTIHGLAKIGGIMLCLAGVAILAFYKGPSFKPFHVHHHYLLDNVQRGQDHSSPGHKQWIKGCFLMFTSTVCWSLWVVYQASVLKEYPLKLIFTSLQCLLSAIQSGVVAIAVERDFSQWKLGWDVRLFAILFSAFMTSAVGSNLLAWMIEKKGSVFHAMWTPLGLVITTLFSTFLLGDLLSLGSILGGILLVGSLYSVLWGKSKEEKLKRLNNQACLEDQIEQDSKK